MTHRTAIRGVLAFVAALLLPATANAQLFRSYLARTGSDANPCTLPAPCRLLPAALATVADGGEIWMLDSANYNTATVDITKSVSILAVPGAVGSVVATGGPAISVTSAGLKIALRNLVIVPLPASGATHGIYMTGASTLAIEDSMIADLPGDGIDVPGTGTVKILNTTLRNNWSANVRAEAGAHVTVSGAKILGNYLNVFANSSPATTTTVIVSDSIISGGIAGVLINAFAAGSSVRIFVTRCTIEGLTGAAVDTESGGTGSAMISVSGSMITNNEYGWFNGGGVIKSLGNNHIQDNTTNYGSLTSALLQ